MPLPARRKDPRPLLAEQLHGLVSAATQWFPAHPAAYQRRLSQPVQLSRVNIFVVSWKRPHMQQNRKLCSHQNSKKKSFAQALCYSPFPSCSQTEMLWECSVFHSFVLHTQNKLYVYATKLLYATYQNKAQPFFNDFFFLMMVLWPAYFNHVPALNKHR